MSRNTIVRPFKNVGHGLELLRNRKTLLHMLREVFHGEYKMSLLTVMVIAISVAYVLFPFDFVPDFIPVLGWIDDGLILYLLLRRLVKETQRFNRHKAMERKGIM